MQSKILAKVKNRFSASFQKYFIRYHNTILPPLKFRFCGDEFRNNEYFLASAKNEALRIIKYCGLTARSKVLDVGCGPGRLPIGILNSMGEIERYIGADIDYKSIQWSQNYITQQHPKFKFIHLDVENLRYNPAGKKIDSHFKFSFKNQEFDIIYLYSVFSHMEKDDVECYLKEFQRLLIPDGKIFLTGFFEEGVPEVTVNPGHYRRDWEGALHCVRYNKSFFMKLLSEYAFQIERFDYETETDGQSAIYASKINNK